MVDKTVERLGDQVVPGLWGLMLLLIALGTGGLLLGLIWFLIALFTDSATAFYYFH